MNIEALRDLVEHVRFPQSERFATEFNVCFRGKADITPSPKNVRF
jgi:hypothetical protein